MLLNISEGDAQVPERMMAMSRRRVLVVEDEAAIALELAALLRDHGAAVVGPACNVEEALGHIARTRIDCAVLDIKLGSGNCGAIAQALTWKVVPFVFVTGCSSSEVAHQYSWWPVITKPYTPIDVIASLQSVLTPRP